MVNCCSSGRPTTITGLPDKLIGWVGSAVPPTVEPLARVLIVVKAPKSGFGLRLLPVSVACERRYRHSRRHIVGNRRGWRDPQIIGRGAALRVSQRHSLRQIRPEDALQVIFLSARVLKRIS